MPASLIGAGFKAPAETIFSLEYNTAISVSPLTRKEERLELPGARWRAIFNYPPMTWDYAQNIIRECMSARGSSGTILITDPTKKTPKGTALGTGLIKGAGQTGNSIATDGWTPSQANLFKKGDLVGFQSEAHFVMADCSSNSTGESTITIEPPIRVSPSDNEVVLHDSVPFYMRLVDDNQLSWQISSAGNYSLRLEFVELV